MNNKTHFNIKWLLIISLLINIYFLLSFLYPQISEKINFFTINILILVLVVILSGTLFVILKFITPLNRLLLEIKTVKKELILPSSMSIGEKISFLSKEFRFLFNKIEENKKNVEESIEEKTKEIKDKLYLDDITNLKNRQALIDETKNDEFVSMTVIDIDSFNDINELYGFSTGNLVLIEVGHILEEFAKSYSSEIYRIHGNVFAIADSTMFDFAKYEEFIEKLSQLFRNRAIHIDKLDLDIYVDITLGISIAQDEPLKSANIALKKAKKHNMRFFVYNNEIDTKEIIKNSMYWREKIKKAIVDKTVVPFYQPIYNKDKEIVKYETLMRIEEIDEEGNITYLLPHEFLDISIKTKQYLQLSNDVISKALNDLSKTTKQVSINLSFKDILDRDFVYSLDKNLEDIDEAIKSRIVFEILESDYISDYTLLEDFVNKYRKQGIKIAIDDFGTGYSNFAHILKIRPDYIKIDGSLIKDINEDKNSYEMVKSIIEFSKALNIRVIAEFIHSEEVFETVQALGVDEFQGYYLNKPQINFA